MRRRQVLATGGVASGAVAAACGIGSSGSGGNGAAPSGVGTRDVTLTWQVEMTPEKLAEVDGFLTEWRQRFPKISVSAQHVGGGDDTKVEKALTLAAAGTPFDVIGKLTYIQPLAAPGAVLPIAPLITRDKYDISKYNPAWLQTFGTYDGKLFSIPYGMGGNAMVFVYNRKHFQEAGVKEPSPDWKQSWTYEEYRQIAQQLTKRQGDAIERAGTDQFGNVYFSTPLPFGGVWLKDLKTPACDSPQMIDAYTRWLDLMFKDRSTALSPGAENLGSDRFYNGKVSIYYVVGSQLTNFADPAKYKVEWAMAPFPKGPQAASPDVDTNQLALGNKATQEESWTYVRWLLDKARYAWFMNRMPPLAEDANAWAKENFKQAPANPRVDVLVNGLAVARPNDPMRAHPKAGEISKEVHTPFWNDVRAQKISVKDGLVEAKRKLQGIVGAA